MGGYGGVAILAAIIVTPKARARSSGTSTPPARVTAPATHNRFPPATHAGTRAGIENLKQLAGVRVYDVVKGQPLDLKTLGQNRRPVLLALWATWCDACVHELPLLQSIADKNAGKVSVVGIAQDLNSAGNRKAVHAILTRQHVTFPQYVEKDGETVEERIFGKGVGALPAFALFNREGVLTWSAKGAVTQPKKRKPLLAALAAVRRIPPPQPGKANR